MRHDQDLEKLINENKAYLTLVSEAVKLIVLFGTFYMLWVAFVWK